MRTTVDLDASLLKRLRVEARRRGVTVKELLSTLLRRGLDERRPAPKRFRQKTFSMGEARFNVDKALQFASELEDAEILKKLRLRK
jgi:hypothetical protein